MVGAAEIRASIISRRQQVLAAEIRMLHANAVTAGAVTLVSGTALAFLQWEVIAHTVVSAWWTYMMVVSGIRYYLARRFLAVSSGRADLQTGHFMAVIAAALAGAGWGAASILLYPEAHPANQVVLIFVIGGMMLGAASLLAPRPEAFLAFLLPAGLSAATRLLVDGDTTHMAMSLLAAVFTAAVVVTSWRIHSTIDSSLHLQFENHDLIDELTAAKRDLEELNQQLERRVEARTAELHASNERLRLEITQREQAEDELLRARKLESVGVLAGGIAHDFNNFLTIVSGNIELVKLQLEAGEPVDELLEEITGACTRAAALSSQLLTFAKGGAPVRRVVSIGSLLIDAAALARAGSTATFDLQIPDDLWCVEADPGQISQVFHNLFSNAKQAMADGGTIEVRAHNERVREAPCVRICIEDHGSGIAADVLPRIFDPYFTARPGGRGLGLATVYAIVSKHNGHVGVVSEPGRGTKFTLDLPACPERSVTESAVAAEPARRTARLLVMDDEEALLRLLSSVLGKLGHQVQTARDGAEAIRLCEAALEAGEPFDAILLDLTVGGGMGGLEAAPRIKELDPSAKLIVSSGYSDNPAMADYEAYGFDDVIPKPWTAAELSEVFRRVLASGPERQSR